MKLILIYIFNCLQRCHKHFNKIAKYIETFCKLSKKVDNFI